MGRRAPPLFLLFVIFFICCISFLLVQKSKDVTPTFVPYPDDMLIHDFGSSEPYTTTIFYFLPESGEIEGCDVTIEQERDFLAALFSQWKDLSQLPSSVSLVSHEVVFGKEEMISSGGSAYIQYTPTPPDLFLEISSEIDGYTLFDGLVMDSLVQTIKTAYGNVQALTIVIDGQVVYEE